MTTALLIFVCIIYLTNSETIDCDANNGDCSCSTTLTPGETCILNCDIVDSCKGATLNCTAGNPCIVKCTHQTACSDHTRINGDTATHVSLTCNGTDACKSGMEMKCGSGDCKLQCDSLTACDDWGHISILPDTHSFVCTGFCPLDPPFQKSFSASPTIFPTNIPSKYPTIFPTNLPSNSPSKYPTRFPSNIPTHTTTQHSLVRVQSTIEPIIITAEPTSKSLYINMIPSQLTTHSGHVNTQDLTTDNDQVIETESVSANDINVNVIIGGISAGIVCGIILIGLFVYLILSRRKLKQLSKLQNKIQMDQMMVNTPSTITNSPQSNDNIIESVEVHEGIITDNNNNNNSIVGVINTTYNNYTTNDIMVTNSENHSDSETIAGFYEKDLTNNTTSKAPGSYIEHGDNDGITCTGIQTIQ